MREKRRYLVLRVDISAIREILADIRKNEWGIVDSGNGKILLRLNLKHLNKVKGILASKGICCVGISGTIKKAKQKFWNQKIL